MPDASITVNIMKYLVFEHFKTQKNYFIPEEEET